ncbi:nucleotidyltransferase family protein [Gloeocapsopsis dulcis]|nr:nucleotidyltransferase family protein [Gloeocapsopsis dulcis]
MRSEGVKGVVKGRSHRSIREKLSSEAMDIKSSKQESVPTLPIDISKDKIAEFCQRHYVRKLSLFGSVLRNDFRPESDIDFLVEFEPGKTPGYFKLVSMEMELSEMLEGRKIDLRTPNELSIYFRDRAMAEALVQYDSH